MKRNLLLALVLAFAAGLGQSDASILTSMLGNWKSSGTVYQNGSFIGNARGSSRVTRIGANGLYIVGTTRVGKLPSGTSYLWMYDNGSLTGYVKQGSITIGNVSGSWSASNSTLTYNISVVTNSTTYTQSVTSTLVSKRRFTSISTTSNGLTMFGTATK